MAVRPGTPRGTDRRTLRATAPTAGRSPSLADLGHCRPYRGSASVLALPHLQRAWRRAHALQRSQRRRLGRRPCPPTCGSRLVTAPGAALTVGRELLRPLTPAD